MLALHIIIFITKVNFQMFQLFQALLQSSSKYSFNNGQPSADISSLSPINWWKLDNIGTTITDNGQLEIMELIQMLQLLQQMLKLLILISQ